MKPNVILINCDDLGYGDVGCYGSKLNRTPNLDRMAQNGLKLTDFYSCSPVCSPSRGGMMTGCYPPRISFGLFNDIWVLRPGDGIGLNPKEETISSILQSNGYATKLVGKWHCGDQQEFMPLNHGFDEYFGLPFSNDMGIQTTKEYSRPLPLMEEDTVLECQPDQCTLTSRYTEYCVDFIERNKDRPFFLYLAHMHVHRPLYAEKRFVDSSINGDFGACVEAVDYTNGVILDTLERLDILENTIVIFTSDNGGLAQSGGTNSPLRGAKGTTFEGGQRVPCVIYWQGKISPRVSGEMMSNIDFLPTLLSLCGIEHTFKNKIDGIDCSEFVTGGEKSGRDVFYYYLANYLDAVRVGDWKLHMSKGGWASNQLYNLREDIGETNNLWQKRQDVVKKLEPMMEECRQRLGDATYRIKGNEVRPAGTVDSPKYLADFDDNHPYIVALYDRDDMG